LQKLKSKKDKTIIPVTNGYKTGLFLIEMWLLNIFFYICILSAAAAATIYQKPHSKRLEMSGIGPETFHMRSERSTTELHPLIFVL
jgi:hypothetical protein